MSSRLLDITDAVRVELANGVFTPAFTPTRTVQPTLELAGAGTLHVTVVPAGREETPFSRSDDNVDYTVDIGVQKRFEKLDEVDGLMDLVEQIMAYVRRRALTDAPDVTWVRTANAPAFVPEHLENLRQFTSVVSVTYRAIE